MRHLPNNCFSDATKEERWEIYKAMEDAMLKKAKELFVHCSFSNANVDVYAGVQSEIMNAEKRMMERFAAGRGRK